MLSGISNPKSRDAILLTLCLGKKLWLSNWHPKSLNFADVIFEKADSGRRLVIVYSFYTDKSACSRSRRQPALLSRGF